jgi:hypothetical protein
MIAAVKKPTILELPKKTVVVKSVPSIIESEMASEKKCGYTFDTNHIACSPPGGFFMHNLNKRMQSLY